MTNQLMTKYYSEWLPTAAAICLFFSSCGNNSSQTTPAVKSAGASLFESNCTSCHGSDGKLCMLGAKDLSLSVMTKDEMMEIITNGKNTMTPFGNILSKEDVSTVADHVQTLKVK